MKRKSELILLLLFLSQFTFSQGLFESTLSGSDKNKANYELNGYIRGFGYWAESLNETGTENRSIYSESSLKLKATKTDWGKAFADIRFRTGNEYNENLSEIQIREAWVAIKRNKFGLKIGQQIETWGRADGFNPTNNITPQNYFMLSPEPDDFYMGNFMLKATYKPFEQMEARILWIPKHKASIYRFDLFGMPDYVSFVEGDYPSANLKNSTLAAKIGFTFSKFDGSISWFKGHDPMPALNYAEIPLTLDNGFHIKMQGKSFGQQTIGLDFSTSFSDFGIRGEAAWKQTDKELYSIMGHTPKPELNWVLGIDYSVWQLNIIAQYIGKHIIKYSPIPEPIDMDPTGITEDMLPYVATFINLQMKFYNSIIFDQTKKYMHSASTVIRFSNTYETFSAELFGLYNFSTKEYMLRPQISYDFTDAFRLTAGAQYYHGEKWTRFDWIEKVFNGGYLQLKISF